MELHAHCNRCALRHLVSSCLSYLSACVSSAPAHHRCASRAGSLSHAPTNERKFMYPVAVHTPPLRFFLLLLLSSSSARSLKVWFTICKYSQFRHRPEFISLPNSSSSSSSSPALSSWHASRWHHHRRLDPHTISNSTHFHQFPTHSHRFQSLRTHYIHPDFISLFPPQTHRPIIKRFIILLHYLLELRVPTEDRACLSLAGF